MGCWRTRLLLEEVYPDIQEAPSLSTLSLWAVGLHFISHGVPKLRRFSFLLLGLKDT